MACFSYAIPLATRCSTSSNNQDPNKQSLNKIKITGSPTRSLKVDILGQTSGVAKTLVASVQNGHISKEQMRQNIPTTKQFVDYHRQGLIIEEGVGYRQTVAIRSYEVGADKTATQESILNLLQETALNHVWMSGLLSNGFGATHGMMKNDLIWVVSRMQVQVDRYPIWLVLSPITTQ